MHIVIEILKISRMDVLIPLEHNEMSTFCSTTISPNTSLDRGTSSKFSHKKYQKLLKIRQNLRPNALIMFILYFKTSKRIKQTIITVFVFCYIFWRILSHFWYSLCGKFEEFEGAAWIRNWKLFSNKRCSSPCALKNQNTLSGYLENCSRDSHIKVLD